MSPDQVDQIDCSLKTPSEFLITMPSPHSRHPATTFHRFLKLPVELRLEIWALASPPCAVSLQSRGGRPGPTFHVNREARSLYTLAFLRPPMPFTRNSIMLPDYSNRPVPSDIIPSAKQRAVYIDFGRDTLNLSVFRQPRVRNTVASIYNTAVANYPVYMRRVESVMFGLSRVFEERGGCKEWWGGSEMTRREWTIRAGLPWERFEEECEACKRVIFVFGGDEWTGLRHLVELDGQGQENATEDEAKSMMLIRGSLDSARRKGHCKSLDVRFARDRSTRRVSLP